MQDHFLSWFNSFSTDTEGLTPENLLERSKKDLHFTPGSDMLVVCLPYWNQPLWSFGMVKSCVVSAGDSFLSYQFPRAILCDNSQLTKQCFEIISQTVRNDIKKLKEKYGFSKCVLVALSLSSSFGSMVYRENPDISEVIMIVPGENLARDMWYGCRTWHLRKSYIKQGWTEEKLEEVWHALASENNMPDRGTKVSLYFAKEDKVIPYKLSKNLIAVLQNRGFKVRAKQYQFLGHYALSYWFLLFPKHFLKRH